VPNYTNLRTTEDADSRQTLAPGSRPLGRVIATIDEYNANVPEDPWVCPCGEVLDKPGDPAVIEVPQPDYLVAKAVKSR
jgi:hypothetical protein